MTICIFYFERFMQNRKNIDIHTYLIFNIFLNRYFFFTVKVRTQHNYIWIRFFHRLLLDIIIYYYY